MTDVLSEKPEYVLCNECIKHNRLTRLYIPKNPYQKVICAICGTRYKPAPDLFGLPLRHAA